MYDVDLTTDSWSPTKQELLVISAAMHRVSEKALPFERLVVDSKLAMEMFAENKYKVKQIPNIAEKSNSGDAVTLYRVGDHVDISGGPMVGNTSFFGTSLHGGCCSHNRTQWDSNVPLPGSCVAQGHLPESLGLRHPRKKSHEARKYRFEMKIQHSLKFLFILATFQNLANISSQKSVDPS